LAEENKSKPLQLRQIDWNLNMKRHFKIVQVVISLIILVLIFRKVEFNVLLNQFARLNLLFLGPIFVIYLFQNALSSYKWQTILTADGQVIPFRFLLKSYLIAGFISLFLPSSFGGDLYRVYVLKEYNRDYLQNTSSVLFDRVTGLFALVSISIISFVFFYRDAIDLRLIILYIIGVLAFLGFTSKNGIKLLDRYQSKAAKFLVGIQLSFSRYRKNGTVLIICLFISFLFQSNIVLANKLYCLILGIDIKLSYLFVVIPLIYLTEALPISINGLGVREGAFVFFLTKAGCTIEEGLALGMLVLSMRYAFSLTLGGGLFIREMIRSKSSNKVQKGINKSQ
jgi:hypothetical protein